MIIVTGATGKLGRMIVQRLVERVGAAAVGISIRDPGKASDMDAIGVRVREGDFGRPDTLANAFEGATQLLIVSSNARASGGDPIAQHRNAIDAARKVGVRRIVYTSHMAVSPTSKFPPMLDHAATEDMLRDSGVAWTALRHGFYMESGLALIGDPARTGVVEGPLDGKVSWTAHADLAEADAAVLASEGRYDGPTPPLTASEALDLDDFAAIATDLIGKPVERRTLSDAEMRDKLIGRGVPEAAIPISLGLFAASRDGEFLANDPTLEQLIGHIPLTARAMMAERFAKPT